MLPRRVAGHCEMIQAFRNTMAAPNRKAQPAANKDSKNVPQPQRRLPVSTVSIISVKTR